MKVAWHLRDTCGSLTNRSHIPWDPFKDKGVLGESKKARAKHAKPEGETAVKLDPLGVLIMGKMPGFNEGKIMPI